MKMIKSMQTSVINSIDRRGKRMGQKSTKMLNRSQVDLQTAASHRFSNDSPKSKAEKMHKLTDEGGSVGFSNLTLGQLSPNLGKGVSRVHNMSVNTITYRNSANVEGHLKERARQRNQIMKRQMSQFLISNRD